MLPGGSTIEAASSAMSRAIDLGVKSDTSAVVGVAANLPEDSVDLAFARKWTPAPGGEVDLGAVEAYIREIHARFALIGVLYDPWQAKSIAQRLAASGIPMIEFPQTPDRLTLMSQGLLDLIRRRKLRLYEDADLREHALNAVAVETVRGWRLAKERTSAKIDLCVALAMSCWGITNLAVITPAFDEFEWQRRETISPY